MSLGDIAKAIMRSAPVTAVSRTLTRGRLRILAYHGVPDADRFAEQMEYVARAFTPVHEDQVIAAIHEQQPLPKGAAWVTFDDGDPSVVTNGLAPLERLGIPATMFVCPGLIQSGDPFWWRVTEWVTEHAPEAGADFAEPAELTEYGKVITDGRRREMVATLMGRIPHPLPDTWRQLNDADLRRWTGAGMALGNHSWDHPCLDQCGPSAQVDQIRRAHEWLTDWSGRPPRSFAYPNGNFSEPVDQAIRDLGYDVAVMYDNSLTSLDTDPLRLSRVMLEADQPPERLVGVLSGAQPALTGFAGRIRR